MTKEETNLLGPALLRQCILMILRSWRSLNSYYSRRISIFIKQIQHLVKTMNCVFDFEREWILHENVSARYINLDIFACTVASQSLLYWALRILASHVDKSQAYCALRWRLLWCISSFDNYIIVWSCMVFSRVDKLELYISHIAFRGVMLKAFSYRQS